MTESAPPRPRCPARSHGTVLVAVACGALIVLAGCGSSRPGGASTVAAQPSAISVANAVPPASAPASSAASAAHPLSWYGQRYLAILAPSNKEVDVARATKGDAATSAALKKYASLVQSADNELLRVAWPTAAIRSDVVTFVRANGAMVGDLQGITSGGLEAIGSSSTFAKDSATSQADANIVRADLGLPATS